MANHMLASLVFCQQGRDNAEKVIIPGMVIDPGNGKKKKNKEKKT